MNMQETKTYQERLEELTTTAYQTLDHNSINALAIVLHAYPASEEVKRDQGLLESIANLEGFYAT